MKPLPNVWWCEEHQTVHLGLITDWNMDHRMYLHPVYVDLNPERARAAKMARTS